MSDDEGTTTREEPKRTGLSMTYSQSVNRIQEIEAEMSRLAEKESLTPEEDSLYKELRDEVFTVDEHRKRLERADELAQVKMVKGQVDQSITTRRYKIERGTSSSQSSRDAYDRDSILEPDSIEDCRFRDPWNIAEMRTFGQAPSEVAAEYRARALDACGKMKGCSDDIRQAGASIIEKFDDSRSSLAKQCLATSSPAYLRAWSKLSRNQGYALTDAEQRAVENVRAMSLTDAAGGFLVPFQLDPTVIVTSSGVRSDIRQVARQVVATGDVWNGVSSVNVSWSWDPEASEVSDDATVFAQPSIPNYKAAGFVPISIEALEDEANVQQEVGRLLAGGKMDLEGTAFITGTGSGQPTGIITALVASSPTVIVTQSGAADTFTLPDVYKLQGSLPARYRPQATWLANNLVYNLVRAFDTSGGGGFWTNLNDDRPPQLMGRSAIEAEAMDGVLTAAAENYLLVFGDFSNFVITDRIGMSVEFIPHLFHTANNRPSGSRGWYAYYRTGSDSVNDGAFRLLNAT